MREIPKLETRISFQMMREWCGRLTKKRCGQETFNYTTKEKKRRKMTSWTELISRDRFIGSETFSFNRKNIEIYLYKYKNLDLFSRLEYNFSLSMNRTLILRECKKKCGSCRKDPRSRRRRSSRETNAPAEHLEEPRRGGVVLARA